MKRLLDLALALVMGVTLFVPFILIALAVFFTSSGPVIYWSVRMGQNNRLFKMPKFRSLLMEAPVLASHLLENPSNWLTPIGSFLRKSSLDELPQIWSILLGNMSFVGPRPALFNQKDLIELRTKMGVHSLKPGLTGWAQVNGRDEVAIIQKVKFDAEYLERKSFIFDLYILWLTVLRVMKSDGVSH